MPVCIWMFAKTELKTSPISRPLEYSIMQRDEIFDTQDMLSF